MFNLKFNQVVVATFMAVLAIQLPAMAETMTPTQMQQQHAQRVTEAKKMEADRVEAMKKTHVENLANQKKLQADKVSAMQKQHAENLTKAK
jgi:hypothetical protein